jgi:hypothetical protein
MHDGFGPKRRWQRRLTQHLSDLAGIIKSFAKCRGPRVMFMGGPHMMSHHHISKSSRFESVDAR